MEPKILVASPVYDKMEYCFEQFINSLLSLDYGNYDILIADNSKTADFYERAAKLDIMEENKKIIFIRDDSGEIINLKRLVHSRNLILDYAKEKNYDFCLMMDSDVIPPKNLIRKLLFFNKDIVSGLYYNYFQSGSSLKLLPVAYLYLTDAEFVEMKKNHALPETIKSRFDIRRHMTNEEADTGELLEVLYPSAGCMLLSKEVLTKVRYGLEETGILTSDDIFFFNESRKLGICAYVDTSLKCEHLSLGKFEKTKNGFKNPFFD